MLHRNSFVAALCALAMAGCSERSAPPTPTPPAAAPATAASNANSSGAKLTAQGVAAQYTAHFDADKLVHIEERRQPQSGGTLAGEYTFEGARLLHYRGAKVGEHAELDLQFDMRGVLQSGQAPDVTEQDITAIRDRAQLLRSHALAQRASRKHSDY